MKRSISVLSVLLAIGSCTPEPAIETPSPELIVIFSIDTLRSDRIGAYGSEKGLTPAIDSFASDALLFEAAWSHVPLTLPSHVTMLTGKLPAETGVRDNLGFRLDPAADSLPKRLSAAGYETAGFVSSWVMRGETGLGSHFDDWGDEMEAAAGGVVGEIQRDGAETIADALGWLDRTTGRRFLLVHIFEPHTPWVDTYEDDVAKSDEIFGKFVDGLNSRGLYEDATILLVSDHGEGLGDHGELEHGIFLYREALQIPMILRSPGVSPGRVADNVGLIDVAPSILNLAGEGSAADELPGLDLLGATDRSGRRIVSETLYPRIHLGWSELVSVIEEREHLIDAPTVELYDLAVDPDETSNVADERRRAVTRLRAVAKEYDRSIDAIAAVTPGEAERLASLGYLTGGSAPEGPLPDPKERIGDLVEYRDAVALLDEGRVGGALERIESVTARNPIFADAWVLRGRIEETAGMLERAASSYRRAIEIAPNLAGGVSLSIAKVMSRMGELESAIEHARLAERSHPVEASVVIGRALLYSGDLAAAERQLVPLMESSSANVEVAMLRSEIEIARGNPKRALEILMTIDEEQRDVAGYQLLLGDALARNGQTMEAIESFTREISSHPGNVEAYLRLIALRVLRGEAERTESVAMRLVRTVPGARGDLVDAYRRLGREDLARRWETR